MPSRAEARNGTVLDSQVLCCFLHLQLLHLFMFGFVFLGLALKEDLVLCYNCTHLLGSSICMRFR